MVVAPVGVIVIVLSFSCLCLHAVESHVVGTYNSDSLFKWKRTDRYAGRAPVHPHKSCVEQDSIIHRDIEAGAT